MARRKWPLAMTLAASALALTAAGGAAWWAGWSNGGARVQTQAGQGAAARVGARIACELPALPNAAASTAELAAAPGSTAPPGMAWVPGGQMTPGDSVYPEEAGGRPLTVAGFWMDRTEVTNDQFARFVAATGYVTVAERTPDASALGGAPREMLQPGALVFVIPRKLQGPPDPLQWWRYVPRAQWRQPGGPGTAIEGRGSMPVTAVALEDAQAYARWAGRQLPTEAQWEWAAREARQQERPQHEQPVQANTWQGQFPMMDASRDGYAGLAPVGCYAGNALGLHDMIGNVWEWTRDSWRPGHEDAPAPAAQVARAGAAGHGGSGGTRESRGPAQGVIKGGSFLCSPDYCMRYRAGARQPQDVDLATSHLGFRTILEASASR